MLKRLGLTHILLACALVIAGAALHIIYLPGNNSNFQQKNVAQDNVAFESYAKGTVTEVMFEQIDDGPSSRSITQHLKVRLANTQGAGQEVVIEHTQILDTAGSVHYRVGDRVVLGLIPSDAGDEYVVVDRYRLPGVYVVVGIFLAIALGVGRRRGLTSLIGLGITGCILLFFIAPQILAGKDPFLVALVGAGAIILVSMFVSHGFTRRIQIAAVSTIIALVFSALAAYLFVSLSKLFGFGQSDAFLLQTGFFGTINLQGVLLAGIIVSVLGVLDDVTTAQTAAVEELHKTNPSLSFRSLYQKGLSIGREHIASLINTLILVYAGAALPLFLLLTLQKSQPIWVLLNSEFMAEELVKSLVGSTALILAVPVSTLLAAYLFIRNSQDRT